MFPTCIHRFAAGTRAHRCVSSYQAHPQAAEEIAPDARRRRLHNQRPRRAVQSVRAHRLSHPSVAEAHAANAVDTFADFRRVATAIANPRLRPSLCTFGQPTAYLVARVSFESEAIEALNKKLNTWEQVKKVCHHRPRAVHRGQRAHTEPEAATQNRHHRVFRPARRALHLTVRNVTGFR